jgi:Right handed beta helix region
METMDTRHTMRPWLAPATFATSLMLVAGMTGAPGPAAAAQVTSQPAAAAAATGPAAAQEAVTAPARAADPGSRQRTKPKKRAKKVIKTRTPRASKVVGFDTHPNIAVPYSKTVPDDVKVETEVAVRTTVRVPVAKPKTAPPSDKVATKAVPATKPPVRYRKKSSVKVKMATEPRPVLVQARLGSGPWTTQQTLTTADNGKVHIDYPILPGTFSWRVVAPTSDGAPTGVSTIRRISGTNTNVFAINPGSSPAPGMYYADSAKLNADTKDWFLINSYMEALEQLGGGTLILQPGSYTVASALPVPSNTTIVLQDGAVVHKGTTTGGKMRVSLAVFSLVPPSLMHKKDAVGGHDGAQNVTIRGEGSATIDLGFATDAVGIVAGHNRNLTIQGINFRNMKSGHFIELTAAQNAVISGNTFQNAKRSEPGWKEAINIDTPDKTTYGFNSVWSNHDHTPDEHVLIDNNTFTDLERAIGTHKYSGVSSGSWLAGSLHNDITISNNTIVNMSSDAIRVMNWRSSRIVNNVIDGVGCEGCRGLLASGVDNLTFTGNVLRHMARPAEFMPWRNVDTGTQYVTVFNELTQANVDALAANRLGVGVGESTVRINDQYLVFDNPRTVQITGRE